jgi:hypothetical protein
MAFAYYHYNPSLPAAAIFIILFILTTILHFIQMFRRKTWFMVPFVIGGCCKCTYISRRPLIVPSRLTQWCKVEILGYIARAISCHQTPNWTLGPFIMQTLFVLLAPTLFAASVYMVLGRIILTTEAEHLSFIRKRWLTKIFVMGDILSFLVQSGGKFAFLLLLIWRLFQTANTAYHRRRYNGR